VLNEEVADTALGLLLCTAREFPQAERYVRAGKWATKGYPLSKATLRDRSVGMVGMGRIGKAIAHRLEAVGVPMERGFVKVSPTMETSVKGIYAIGDMAGVPLLAHKAMAEGVVAAEAIAGKHPRPVDYGNVPSCTYCRPQVASIGLTEAKAKEGGREVAIGKFPFTANGKAVALGETEGFVKVVADKKTGEILGVHIIGPEATEMIHEFAVGRTLEATVDEIMHTIHAHPTLSEAALEATLAALGQAIHI